jgi:hypothetical protein
MSEFKGTPGPWGVVDLGDAHFVETNHRYAVSGGLCGRVAKVEGMGDEYLANARLIAAAPELLAACQAMIRRIDNVGDDQDLMAVRKQMKDAIAKATEAKS